MCGIIGILSEDSINLSGRVKKGLKMLADRGPDGNGIWVGDRVGLGHSRLAVTGINNGKQPITNADSSIIVVANGEFYDYKRLKMTECDGYSFKTSSDSEILIPLYLKYGIKGMMEYLRGEFSFLLYDDNLKTLYAVRDRFGIKPLVWVMDKKGDILMASKVKALIAMGIEVEMDIAALRQVFALQYQPLGATLFKGIHQVRPGNILECKLGEYPKEYAYWDLVFRGREASYEFKSSENEAIKSVRNLMYESVKLRGETEVPVCCHLSGGLDSSGIAGILASQTSERLNCFSIVFTDIGDAYDEGNLASSTVDLIGGNYHPIEISQKDILDNLADAVYSTEGLAVNGHIACKYLMNKEIRERGYRVALTGEGADELFFGYGHLKQDNLLSLSAKLRIDLEKSLFDDFNIVVGTEINNGMGLNCDYAISQLGYVPSFLKGKASIGYKMLPLIEESWQKEAYEDDPVKIFINDKISAAEWNKFTRVELSSYLWIKSALCNYILNTLGDGCEMAFSIEGRVPFLDHKLAEFVATLPVDYKIKNFRIEKHILREALKPFVTKEVYLRKKHPFQAPPLSRFYDKKILHRIQEELTDRALTETGIFKKKALERVIKKLPDLKECEKIEIEPVIMLLLTFKYLKIRFGL